MSLLRDGIAHARKHGILPTTYRALDRSNIYKPIWNTVTSRHPVGTNIFDRDWELLIILDTCRPDFLTQFIDSISWLNDVGQIRSVGSTSSEWMLQTFCKKHRTVIGQTAFVSGNIWSHRIFSRHLHKHRDHEYDAIHAGFPDWTPVDAKDFGYYETVYPFANQDHRLHPEAEHIPHILTDRAIAVGRQQDYERLVVHYTLPHLNHIARALEWHAGEESVETLMSGDIPITRNLLAAEKSYGPANRGEVSRHTLHTNYLQNLRLALEYVQILINNVNADRAIVTADHGEGLGEGGVWSHPFGCPLSAVKTVPWVSMRAEDQRTYESRFSKLRRTPSEKELREHLEAMGYY